MNRRFLESCLQACRPLPWRSPARFRCTQACLDRCIAHCQGRFHGRARARQLCLNNCRGLAAELGTERVFADHRYRIRSQVALPGGRSGVMDLTTTSQRPARRFHYEFKHLDLSRYRTPTGQLHLAALCRRLPRMTRQVRLLVRAPNHTPRARAIALQRFLRAEFTPHGVPFTVIMPGSPASLAFGS